MYEQRIASVKENLLHHNLTQMIVTDPRSIQYLCGVYVDPGERFLALIINEDPQTTLVYNQMFTLPQNLVCLTRPFKDSDEPLKLLSDILNPAKAVGCDKNMLARFLLPLMKQSGAQTFELASYAIDEARAIKSTQEQAMMRAASRTNDRAMARFKELLHEGVSEAEVAAQLEGIYRELGAEGHSFPPIVSFGKNTADAHHEPDSTTLCRGDVALFDVGCRQENYCSDMTRTFLFGTVTPKQREVYELVRQANEAAEKVIRPGVLFSEIDKAARRVIERGGYGSFFTHRLGHQIGLDVHEPGDVSSVHHEPVKAGMCFSIEPGIYISGEFGVRIEDLVIVTERGCEVLNRFSHDLSIIAV